MQEDIKLQLLLQNLSDANRLRIIKFIGNRECSVSEIVQTLGISQPLVSHHLRVLRENQILETKRNGPFIYYKIRNLRLLDALNMLADIISSNNEAIIHK